MELSRNLSLFIKVSTCWVSLKLKMWAQLLLLDVQGEVDRVGLPAKTSFRAAKVFVGKAQTINVNDHQYSQLVVPTTSKTHFSICLFNHEDNSRSFQFTNLCELSTLVNDEIVPMNESLELIAKKDYIIDIALDKTERNRLIWKFKGHMKRGVHTHSKPLYGARKKRRRDALAKEQNTESSPFGISATMTQDGITAPTASYFAWQAHQTEKAASKLLESSSTLEAQIFRANVELTATKHQTINKMTEMQRTYTEQSEATHDLLQQMQIKFNELKNEMEQKVQQLTVLLHHSNCCSKCNNDV